MLKHLKAKNKISARMEISKTENIKLIQENASEENNKEEHSTLKAREAFSKNEQQQQAFSVESTIESRLESIGEKATESKPEEVGRMDLSYKPKKHWAESFGALCYKSELSNDVSYQIQRNSNDNQSEISNINKICISMPSEELVVQQKKVTEAVLLKRNDSNKSDNRSYNINDQASANFLPPVKNTISSNTSLSDMKDNECSTVDSVGITKSSGLTKQMEKVKQFKGFYKQKSVKMPKKQWAESFSALCYKSELSNDVSLQIQRNSNDNQFEISNINKICKSVPSDEQVVQQKKVTETVLLKRSDSKKEGWSSKIEDRSYNINHQVSANFLPPVKNTISSNASLSDMQDNECSTANSIVITKSSELTKQKDKGDKQFKGFYKQKSVELPINSKIGINYHSEPESNLDFENNSIQKTDCSQFLLRHNDEKEKKILEDEPPILDKYNEECTHEVVKDDPPILKKYYELHSPEEVLSLTEYSPVYSKKDQSNEKRKPTSQEVENIPGTSIGIFKEHHDGYNIKSFVGQFGTSMPINSEPNKSNSSKRTTVIVSPLMLKELPLLRLSSPMISTYGSISNPQNNSSKTENLMQVETWVNFKFNLNFESVERAVCLRDINDRFLHDNCATRTMRLRPYFTIIEDTNVRDDEEFCIEEILSILYYYRGEFLRNGPLVQGHSFSTILPVVPISCHITSDNDYELVGDDLK